MIKFLFKSAWFFALLFCTNHAQQLQKYVNVTGNSEIIKKADQLKFAVQIKTVDESVEASKILNDKYLVDLLIILKSVDIPPENTEISPISFGKNYEAGNGVMLQKGYFTNVIVSFLLNDLKKYYEISNKLSANNAFEINAEYALSDYEFQHRNAYEKAIIAAKEKALYLAAAVGIEVGEVLEIEELHVPEPFMTSNTIYRENPGGNIYGNVSIKRSIRVKFALGARE